MPDPETEYTLRPGATVSGDVLPALEPWNLNPPVLYMNSTSNHPEVLKEFIHARSRMHYDYTVDNDGHRLTLPVVESTAKILVVGDSVGFGVGVDDEYTVASQLQTRLGKTAQIINAAVGGHDGEQCFKTADRLSKNETYAALVYIACQNDFMYPDTDGDWMKEATRDLESFASLSDRFGGRVIVVFHEYLQYAQADLLGYEGWSSAWVRKTDRLREQLPPLCRQLDLTYVDWYDAVEAWRRQERTIFASFALYTDNCHLSKRGCGLMADQIEAACRSLNVPGSSVISDKHSRQKAVTLEASPQDGQ